MALKPKSIIETAVELGRGAVSRGTELVSRRLKDEPDAAPKTPATPAARSTPSTARRTSGAPSTVGAPPSPVQVRGGVKSRLAGAKASAARSKTARQVVERASAVDRAGRPNAAASRGETQVREPRARKNDLRLDRAREAQLGSGPCAPSPPPASATATGSCARSTSATACGSTSSSPSSRSRSCYPPDLENALGRTRQFISFARAAGLCKEDRGVVELTEVGRRYIRAGDAAQPFDVSPGQAEWLRRQLREKHMTDSIYHGLAIALEPAGVEPRGPGRDARLRPCAELPGPGGLGQREHARDPGRAAPGAAARPRADRRGAEADGDRHARRRPS